MNKVKSAVLVFSLMMLTACVNNDVSVDNVTTDNIKVDNVVQTSNTEIANDDTNIVSEIVPVNKKELFEKIHNNHDFPIGDYKCSGQFYQVNLTNDVPVVTIFVSPLADDTLIEKYVDDAIMIDEIFGKDKEYRDFIKNSSPCHIMFESRGQEVLKLDIDLNMDKQEMTAILKEKMEPLKENFLEEIEAFNESLENDGFIKKDSNNNYYYNLDSHNVSESLTKLKDSFEKLKELYPYSRDEVFELNEALKEVGYGCCSQFNIYIGEYPEGKSIKSSFMDDINDIYCDVYRDCFEKNIYDDTFDGYTNIRFDNYKDCILCYVGLFGDDESPYDKEKYYQRAYKAYEYMYENIYSYGITDIDKIGIYWNYYILTDSGYYQEEQFNVDIDMKTKYSYDEFADYLDENGDASEYTPEIE